MKRRHGSFAGMENELHKLFRDLERYRFLLRTNSDARADKVIRELITEAEARLRELKLKGKGAVA